MNLADPQGMATLRAALGKRILILDGAFGTMVQSLNLDEAAFRNSVLADHPGFLKGITTF
jgi:methionine synthase (B12-dependent) (EC 2.1.1.13)